MAQSENLVPAPFPFLCRCKPRLPTVYMPPYKPLLKNTAFHFYAVQTGSVLAGSDLGSSRYATLTLPSVALIVGAGVNPTDAGEVWHLMDQRFNIPLSHLEQDAFNRADLSKVHHHCYGRR